MTRMLCIILTDVPGPLRTIGPDPDCKTAFPEAVAQAVQVGSLKLGTLVGLHGRNTCYHHATMRCCITHTHKTAPINAHRAAPARHSIVTRHSCADAIPAFHGKRNAVEPYEVLPGIADWPADMGFRAGIDKRTSMRVT